METKTPLYKKLYSPLIVSVILFLVVCIWALVSYIDSITPRYERSFSGVGEVAIQNDQAEISFTFSEVNKDIGIARKTVAEKVNKTYKQLQQQNIVEERDVTTTHYALRPEYEYRRLTTGPSQRTLVGYRITHATLVKIRNIEHSSDAIDTIAQNNPDTISNLTFTLSDDELEATGQKAFALALQDAKKQAQLIEDNSTIRLGKILNIETRDMYTPPTPMRLYAQTASFVADDLPTTPVAVGEDVFTQRITVTYEIEQ